MKRFAIHATLAAAGLIAAAGLLAVTPAIADPAGPAGAAATYERLKTLAGDWNGKMTDGTPVKVSYKVVAGGSALMEVLSAEEMVTMYHLDGDRLVLTHYCGAGNQPRMRAEGLSPDGKAVSFSFLDATNLKPDAGHMRKLTVTLMDADHFSQQWTFFEKGQEKVETFTYERKKS